MAILKHCGSEIGERKYRSIKLIGQPKKWGSEPGETYQDETKEAKAFKHSVELRFKLRTDLEELSKKIRDIELNSENLMSICNAVNKLKELIGE